CNEVVYHVRGQVVRTGEAEFAAGRFAYGGTETGDDVCVHGELSYVRCRIDLCPMQDCLMLVRSVACPMSVARICMVQSCIGHGTGVSASRRASLVLGLQLLLQLENAVHDVFG